MVSKPVKLESTLNYSKPIQMSCVGSSVMIPLIQEVHDNSDTKSFQCLSDREIKSKTPTGRCEKELEGEKAAGSFLHVSQNEPGGGESVKYLLRLSLSLYDLVQEKIDEDSCYIQLKYGPPRQTRIDVLSQAAVQWRTAHTLYCTVL